MPSSTGTSVLATRVANASPNNHSPIWFQAIIHTIPLLTIRSVVLAVPTGTNNLVTFPSTPDPQSSGLDHAFNSTNTLTPSVVGVGEVAGGFVEEGGVGADVLEGMKGWS